MAKLQRPIDATALLALIGLRADERLVLEALDRHAHGMRPLIGDDDDSELCDWITVNEVGLEFGFEDEAFVLAEDEDRRGDGRLMLTQVYFYGETDDMHAFPDALPFGLAFADDRAAVQAKLDAIGTDRRSFVRDCWQLQDYEVTTAYREDDDRLESVLCYRPYRPWPSLPASMPLATIDEFVALFGMRWSSPTLRERLARFRYGEHLAEVRSDRSADLLKSFGLELTFAPASEVPQADQKASNALVLAGVTFYGPRVFDAREWAGPLPYGLHFIDAQRQIGQRVGRAPDEHEDFDREGFALWHLEAFTLRVEYSNIENHALRVSILAPGYWTLSGAGES